MRATLLEQHDLFAIISLVTHGYLPSERCLTALVAKLQAAGFENLEDVGGLPDPVIDTLGVSLADCVFLKTVAAKVLVKAFGVRNSKSKLVDVPALPVNALKCVEGTVRDRRRATEVAGMGPTQAIKKLRNDFAEGTSKTTWFEQARLQALLGSCPHSLRSFQSGLQCYVAFAVNVLVLAGRELPPTVANLLARSTVFRYDGPFNNYIGHVKLASQIAQVSAASFDDASLCRAKISIAKGRTFIYRKPMFIFRPLLRDVMRIGIGSGMDDVAMLFLTAYVFLLRLPSGALPIVTGGFGLGHGLQQAQVLAESDCIS